MRATLATRSSTVKEYLYEIKYDGYRLLAAAQGGGRRPPHHAQGERLDDALSDHRGRRRKLDARECVIDGEACIVDDAKGARRSRRSRRGSPERRRRAARLRGLRSCSGSTGAIFAALPLEERKELLEALLPAAFLLSRSRGRGRFSRRDRARRPRRAGSRASSRRRKARDIAPAVRATGSRSSSTAGRTAPSSATYPLAGTTDEVGALLLAVVDADGKLHFAGRVGTGFDARTRKELAKPHRSRRRRRLAERSGRAAHQGRALVDAEARLRDSIRQLDARPAPRGRRAFSAARRQVPMECVREEEKLDVWSRPRPPADGAKPGREALEPRQGPVPAGRDHEATDLRLLHEIAPFMLPHLAGRPLTLQRWPDGIDGEEWYQQNAPDEGARYVRLVDVGPKHGNKKRIVADNARDAPVARQPREPHHPPVGEPHSREARTKGEAILALGQPDYAVLDLDPGDGPWAHLIEVATGRARSPRGARDAERGQDERQARDPRRRARSRGVLRTGRRQHSPRRWRAPSRRCLPKISTVERMKAKREGKLYIDYLQNGEGKTIVAPYTLRALDGAPVSTPIAWDEVTEALDPRGFTMRVVLDRVAKHGDLFAVALGPGRRIPQLG
jgi:bifunctional non-homologous end joining protein LigD